MELNTSYGQEKTTQFRQWPTGPIVLLLEAMDLHKEFDRVLQCEDTYCPCYCLCVGVVLLSRMDFTRGLL